jgi:hypothetical protein
VIVKRHRWETAYLTRVRPGCSIPAHPKDRVFESKALLKNAIAYSVKAFKLNDSVNLFSSSLPVRKRAATIPLHLASNLSREPLDHLNKQALCRAEGAN